MTISLRGSRCNSAWKRNLFPIDEKPRTTPLQGRNEIPLLLNPFEGEDPVDHIEYDKLGQVKALNGSKFGKATIATCGLRTATVWWWCGTRK